MPNRLRISVALALGCLTLGSSVSKARAGGATVQGTVKLVGAAPSPPSLKVTKDASSCGPEYASDAVAVSADGGLANVVVSLRAEKPTATAPLAGRATLDQVGCRYQPHVQTVVVGSELTLVNSDRVLHNVHGNIGPVTVFNLAMPIKGQKLPTKLTRAGLIRLRCDAGHSWMNAWVHVFDHPHHAVTDGRGHFEIRDVPPGTYTLEYWHEPLDGKGPGITKTSRLVVGDKATRADGTLKL